MNKRLLPAMLIIAALLAAGCSSGAPVAESPDASQAPQPQAAATPAPEPTAQPGPSYTLPENDMGLIDATVADLQELVNSGASFYLYVEGGELVPYDHDGMREGVATLLKDYVFPMDFYYVEDSILTEEEYAVLQQVLGTGEVAVIAEDGRGVATYGGLYAFENGALKATSYDFVPGEENTNIPSKVISFIFASDLFRNDHGWEMVSYEQLADKISSGEKFMVYIGRDTCPYCMPFALCLESALESGPVNIPLYYFYTQSFKTAIDSGAEGAQETWDGVKEDIGFQYTPSLLVFEGGEQVLAYDGGVGSEYFDMTDDEKQSARSEVAADLERWLADNALTGAAG